MSRAATTSEPTGGEFAPDRHRGDAVSGSTARIRHPTHVPHHGRRFALVPMMLDPRRVPLFVVGTVIVLVVAIGGFWGYRSGVGAAFLSTARLSKTTARMADGRAVFVADFHLANPSDKVRFAYQQEQIRSAIIDSMRKKSRYMVESSTARNALAVQMANVANRIAKRRIASRVTFAEFELVREASARGATGAGPGFVR